MSAPKFKLCRDCKHFRGYVPGRADPPDPMFNCGRTARTRIDVVDGRPYTDGGLQCRNERRPRDNAFARFLDAVERAVIGRESVWRDRCGPEGKY